MERFESMTGTAAISFGDDLRIDLQPYCYTLLEARDPGNWHHCNAQVQSAMLKQSTSTRLARHPCKGSMISEPRHACLQVDPTIQ